MKANVADIAELVSGCVLREGSVELVTGFASLEDASDRQVSFYASKKFEASLAKTKAGLIIVTKGLEDALPEWSGLITVDDAAIAFDQIVAEYGEKPPEFVAGFANGSHVDATVMADQTKVSVLPGAVVLKNASLGDGTTIGAGAVIGERVQIGADCHIGPNVTVREGCMMGDRVSIHGGTVIGGDGFGYEFENGRHRKVDQMGIVRIENDVEIGSGTTIDRARFGETVIGEGTKIDNQVQIGHNAIIGKHCIIVAQCGISGSAKLGNYVTLAARVGIAGHIEIADQVTVGGKSGVISSITEPGGTYFGYPAKPIKETLRNEMRIKKLGGLLNRVKELEKKMEALDDGE